MGAHVVWDHGAAGSSPVTPTIQSGEIPKWLKGADCKSVVSDFGGSNPPFPTIIENNKERIGAFFFTFNFLPITMV